MGRIITAPDGRRGHVGGRLHPKRPHGVKLHLAKYNLNLSAWPTTPTSTSFAAAPAAQPCLLDIKKPWFRK